MVRTANTTTRDERLVQGVVRNLSLFSGIPPDNLAALARGSWVLPAARGAILVSHGTLLPGILALAYGSLKLVLRKAERGERALRVVTALQTFGESSVLLRRASPYDAVALQDSKVVVLPAADVFALLEGDARFARRMVNVLAQRKADLYAEMEAATLLSGTQRLASYLRDLAGSERSVSLPFSKTLVASRLGVKKETLSRLLRDLVERRVIDVTRGDIAILEPGRLEELAESG